ncbi:MAG TPA: helix-turn-helix transcriptional regulator [Syntrophomonadaceae bacterium]|nr:helix-turn-helix transcriptional regulator [Syntrophomonadaceae bacterium]
MEIGEMIKKRREKLGFSQRQLAYLSGVSNTEIKRIEDGDRKQPSQEILCKLANPLRV